MITLALFYMILGLLMYIIWIYVVYKYFKNSKSTFERMMGILGLILLTLVVLGNNIQDGTNNALYNEAQKAKQQANLQELNMANKIREAKGELLKKIPIRNIDIKQNNNKIDSKSDINNNSGELDKLQNDLVNQIFGNLK